MPREELERRAREAFRSVLKCDLPEGDFARDSIEPWSSLRHVEIVFLLEEMFEVQFTEADVAEMKTFSEVIRRLEQRIAA